MVPHFGGYRAGDPTATILKDEERFRFSCFEAACTMLDEFHDLIGSDADTILWWQMVVRGTLIFFYTLLLVRLGSKRIFGKNTSFDIVLGVILGSVMSRALTANAQFFPSLVAATALVILHWALATLALRSPRLGHFVKGTEDLLVRDGRVDQRALRRSGMTEHDLREALRSNGGTERVEKVKAAYLERNGEVSVITGSDSVQG